VTANRDIRIGGPVRPIRIRILQTMNGIIFSVRCRACGMTFSYSAELADAFTAVDAHINRHRQERAERDGEIVLEKQH
jgi:hypothetical protein